LADDIGIRRTVHLAAKAESDLMAVALVFVLSMGQKNFHLGR